MSTDPMQKFGKNSMDMAMTTFGAWTKKAQAIATEFVDYSKRSLTTRPPPWKSLWARRAWKRQWRCRPNTSSPRTRSFVTESAKIGELYAELAQEAYKPFEGSAYQDRPAIWSERTRLSRKRTKRDHAAKPSALMRLALTALNCDHRLLYPCHAKAMCSSA